jgi:hypothetical protein
MQRHVLAAEKRSAFKLAYSPYLDRSRLHAGAATNQMAEDFRIFAANAGSVSETDLEVLGWTRAQIATYASAARQAANSKAQG